MADKRNLIIAPVGDASWHRSWISGADKNFDLMIIYYGPTKDRFKEDADYYFQNTGMYKFENIHLAVNRYRDIVKGYDAVWFPDHDIICNAKDLNKLFKLFHEYDLDLAQPSLTLASYSFHKITKQNPFCKLRYVNFIESMCPLFKTDALFKVLDTFTMTRSGLGLDFLWPKILNNNKLGIIDSVAVYHKVDSKMRAWEGESAHKIIIASGIDEDKELALLMQKHNLSWTTLEYSRIAKHPVCFPINWIRAKLMYIVFRIKSVGLKKTLKGFWKHTVIK